MEQPTPDRKDWTWVLERTCESCGLDAGQLDRSDMGTRIRANAATWRALLARGSMVAARPPTPPTTAPVWSALEYGCHVRDVYRRFHDRIGRMLTEDAPSFADWDQNHAAVEGGYGEQDPGRVSYDLALIAG
ncbi:MAG: DinB family protein, partial [Actinomycetia bacterium]|nr:DinB family protein [Actinomycetes bacterium]